MSSRTSPRRQAARRDQCQRYRPGAARPGRRPHGITVELARELARRLGLPIELVQSAGRVTDALKTGAWDIAFLANEPVRAAVIDFTAPNLHGSGGFAPEGDRGRRSRRRALSLNRWGARKILGTGGAEYRLHRYLFMNHPNGMK
jgi:hypothetical protein